MAEKSENEASKTGQDVETPETEQDVKRDRLGEPYGDSGTASGYRESEDHVPDPTAMTGTLETSGTGGGVHERLTGTTRIFGDAEEINRRVESVIDERITALKEELRVLIAQQETSAQAANIPQQTVEQHGLPTHTGNIIASHDDSGAARDAERSGNVDSEARQAAAKKAETPETKAAPAEKVDGPFTAAAKKAAAKRTTTTPPKKN